MLSTNTHHSHPVFMKFEENVPQPRRTKVECGTNKAMNTLTVPLGFILYR